MRKYHRGEHPVSLANLRPNRGGENRNPTGNNQHTRVHAAQVRADRALGALIDAADHGRPELANRALEAVVQAFVDLAIAGDRRFIVAIMDRVWPVKPPEPPPPEPVTTGEVVARLEELLRNRR